MLEQLEQQAADYLKANKGYKRMLHEVLVRYKKLGRLGGMIKLQGLSYEEQQILAGIDYKWYGATTCNVSVQDFVKHFKQGRFAEVDFLEVLARYDGAPLVPQRVEQEALEKKQVGFVMHITKQLESDAVRTYWQMVWQEKKRGYQVLLALYKEDQKVLEAMMMAIDATMQFMDQRTQVYVSLVMVATQITRDPHYYDFDTSAFKVLLYVLAYKQAVDYPNNVPDTNTLLYEEGFLRDELSTATICYNLCGYEGDQSLEWDIFSQRREPLQLMLYNLKRVTHVIAPHDTVYVVENPTVFAQLLEVCPPDVGLVCTRGQLTTADLRLLDLLVQGGAILYYSGDFDPEGLQIAQRIKHRYQEQVKLWMYTVANYYEAKSHKSVANRLNKLDGIQLIELLPVVEVIQKEQVAAYEEALIIKMIQGLMKERCE